MDNSDPEIQFYQSQDDLDSLQESPWHSTKGQREDRHYDGQDGFNRYFHCCNV